MSSRISHTCKRKKKPSIKKLYPDTCKACKAMAEQLPPPRRSTMVQAPDPAFTALAQEPAADTAEPAADALDPIGVFDPEELGGVAPGDAPPSQAEIAEAMAVLAAAGLAAPSPAAAPRVPKIAPSVRDQYGNLLAVEPRMVHGRDYGNKIVEKIVQDGQVYYLCDDLRYNRSVAVLGPEGKPGIDGYAYELQP